MFFITQEKCVSGYMSKKIPSSTIIVKNGNDPAVHQ